MTKTLTGVEDIIDDTDTVGQIKEFPGQVSQKLKAMTAALEALIDVAEDLLEKIANNPGFGSLANRALQILSAAQKKQVARTLALRPAVATVRTDPPRFNR